MILLYKQHVISDKGLDKRECDRAGGCCMEIQEELCVVCNMCGRRLKAENGLLKEDAFEAAKEWGYFSEKDLELHRFTICEACYDAWIKTFRIPVEKRVKKEAM